MVRSCRPRKFHSVLGHAKHDTGLLILGVGAGSAETLFGRAWTCTGRNRQRAYLSRTETREFKRKLILVSRVLKITKHLMWELEEVPLAENLLLRHAPKYEAETGVTSLDPAGDQLFDFYCEHARRSSTTPRSKVNWTWSGCRALRSRRMPAC